MINSEGKLQSPIIEGSIYATHPSRAVPGYYDYVMSSAMWDMGNLWYQQAWEGAYNCVMVENQQSSAENICTFNASLVGGICTFDFDWVVTDRIYDSIYVYAHSLHNLISSNCPWAFENKSALKDCVNGNSLYEQILQTRMIGVIGSIEFTAQGDLLETLVVKQFSKHVDGEKDTQVIVGTWNVTAGLSLNDSAVDWTMFMRSVDGAMLDGSESRGPLESVCSKPCNESEYVSSRSSSCCWTCSSCRSNEVNNHIENFLFASIGHHSE